LDAQETFSSSGRESQNFWRNLLISFAAWFSVMYPVIIALHH